MNTLEVHPALHLIVSFVTVYARWAVGLVLTVAGAAKATNPREFTDTLSLFGVLPRKLSNQVIARTLALTISGIELALGMALVLGLFVKLAVAAAAVLFCVFLAVMLLNLYRHRIVNCGCFGPYSNEAIGPKSVLRNMFFLILCVIVFRFADGYLAMESVLLGTPFQADHLALFFMVTGVGVGTVLSVLALRLILGVGRISNYRDNS